MVLCLPLLNRENCVLVGNSGGLGAVYLCVCMIRVQALKSVCAVGIKCAFGLIQRAHTDRHTMKRYFW